jgi:hypothetical protein
MGNNFGNVKVELEDENFARLWQIAGRDELTFNDALNRVIAVGLTVVEGRTHLVTGFDSLSEPGHTFTICRCGWRTNPGTDEETERAARVHLSEMNAT